MSEGLPKNKKLIPISEAAKVLGVSIDTVRRWDKKGILRSKRVDGKNRHFSISDLEKIKSARPYSISEASKALGISATTLRRLENKGLIKPDRNEAGERVYTKESLEKFLNSEYLLRQKKIESLNPLYGVPANKTLAALQHEIFGESKEISELKMFRKTFYIVATGFILIIVIITVLFLLFPVETASFLGYEGVNKTIASGIRPLLEESNQVLGTKYAPSNQKTSVLGIVLKPLSGVSLYVVKQISPQTYQQIVPKKIIEDVNDIWTIDQKGNVTPKVNIQLPDVSFLKVGGKDGEPPQTIVQQIVNKEIAQELVSPSSIINQLVGIQEIKSDSANLTVSTGDNISTLDLDLTGFTMTISKDSVTTDAIKDGAVTTAKLASGVGGTPADNSITTGKIKDGEVKEGDLADGAVASSKISDGTITNADLSSAAAIVDSKLAQLTTASKVAGSAVQLNSSGGLENSSGLTLKTTCSADQVLSWDGDSWECSNTGSGSGDITAVTAGNGLTDGGTSGAVTLNIGAGSGISVAADAVSLATSGVTADTYGSASVVPVIVVDAYGRITSASNTTIGGLTVSNFSSANISQWTNDSNYITASSTITGLIQSTAAGNAYFTGGNVGIGTSVSDYNLKVLGTGYFSSFLGVGSSMNVSGNVGVGGSLTVTSGLSLPNSSILNANLVNSGLTVTAGTGLTGGGAVSLGGQSP